MGVVISAALGLGYVYAGRVVLALATPSAPFDPATAPPAPDYADPAHWSALPDRVDAADAAVAGLADVDPETAPADVFYVHPTSYLGSSWNARLDDAKVNEATDRGATRIQASAFNGCCAVYAPRYRQANMTAFTSPSEDGQRAIALAGDDVIAAFRHYLAHYNHGRPFILAGHSQGSVLATRLLKEVIAPSAELRGRLVAAYLIGSPLSENALFEIEGVSPCRSATETRCVVAYNARSPEYRAGIELVEEKPTFTPRVCVNPLSWQYDERPAGREWSRGAVFWDDAEEAPTPRPQFASAECDRGTLRVELAETPPRDLLSRMLDRTLGAGNYHAIEYGIFYVDLRENARERVAAFLERQRQSEG
ncbi:MAG TPA: DUF3089 domain-containing protein [Nannocystis sp.]